MRVSCPAPAAAIVLQPSLGKQKYMYQFLQGVFKKMLLYFWISLMMVFSIKGCVGLASNALDWSLPSLCLVL